MFYTTHILTMVMYRIFFFQRWIITHWRQKIILEIAHVTRKFLSPRKIPFPFDKNIKFVHFKSLTLLQFYEHSIKNFIYSIRKNRNLALKKIEFWAEREQTAIYAGCLFILVYLLSVTDRHNFLKSAKRSNVYNYLILTLYSLL